MRSFALAALTFLTLGVFSFAAPTPILDNNNINVIKTDPDAVTNVKVGRGDHGDSKHDDSEKDDSTSLEEILHKLIVDVEHVIDAVADFDGKEVTTKGLEPLLEHVVDILEWAIKAVKALVGLDTNSILKTVTGLLDLSGLVQLLCDVLTVVLKLIQLVLKIVSVAVKADILSLLCKILDLVAELLDCILGLSILGGLVNLIVRVVALVDKLLLDIICDLGVESLIKVLGL